MKVRCSICAALFTANVLATPIRLDPRQSEYEFRENIEFYRNLKSSSTDADENDLDVNTIGNGRRLQGQDFFQPIRIFFDTSELEAGFLAQTAELKHWIDDILPAVSRWFGQVLMVRPVEGNLKLPQICQQWTNNKCSKIRSDTRVCSHFTAPQEHFEDKTWCRNGNNCKVSPGGAGIPNADIVV